MYFPLKYIFTKNKKLRYAYTYLKLRDGGKTILQEIL